MPTSQNGWSANDRSVIGSFVIPGTAHTISLRKGDVATVLLDLASWIHAHIERLDTGQRDDWGYAERTVRGSSTTLSNHASGTAVDLNALRHPRGRRGTWGTNATLIRSRLATYDGVIRWGEDYRPPSLPDGMHFEINAGAATVKRVADRIRGKTPTAKYLTLQRGSTGEAVKLIQRFLGVVGPGDIGYGIYGPKTESAVKAYQKMRGLVTDGVCGPATWAETGL